MTLFKKNIIGVVRLVFLMLLLAFCQAVSAQQSTFIQLPTGDPSEVLSLRIGVVTQKELDGQNGPPERTITIEKLIDVNSPVLFAKAVSGEAFEHVTVYINGAQFTFSFVLVVNYLISAGTGPDSPPIETVVLQTPDLNPMP